MIKNDVQFQATVERLGWFQQIVINIRRAETDLVSFRMSSSGFLVEIDRMNMEVREYLSLHPSELATTA